MNGEVGRFRYRVEPTLPLLAWLARVRRSDGEVSVVAGSSVRCSANGFFEGSWTGQQELGSAVEATTVFGSGMVWSDEGKATIVTPSHTMSGVFAQASEDGTTISNSLSALLAATGSELRTDGGYPSRFAQTLEGIGNSPIALPADKARIDFHFWWNLALRPEGRLQQLRKPEEAAFASFADYRSRLSSALASVFANANGYEPVVALSSGYDSTTVAVLAAENGCRHVVTFAEGRHTHKTGDDIGDSGEPTAARLGMAAEAFDRAAYLRRSDLPEAEFLATGMSGEDVVMSSFEPSLSRRILLTGSQGNGIWRVGGSTRTDLRRSGLDGASLHEFRLRCDFAFVPLPTFGLTQRPSVMALSASDEMKPWSVGGRYDQPISRRIAEEAGLPRGSFAAKKHAASALLHSEGPAALAPATLAAIDRFAKTERAQLRYPERFKVRRWHRAALKVAPKVRAGGLVAGIETRRRALVHFEPEVGTLLLRWAVSVVQPRYDALADGGADPGTPAEVTDEQ